MDKSLAAQAIENILLPLSKDSSDAELKKAEIALNVSKAHDPEHKKIILEKFKKMNKSDVLNTEGRGIGNFTETAINSIMTYSENEKSNRKIKMEKLKMALFSKNIYENYNDMDSHILKLHRRKIKDPEEEEYHKQLIIAVSFKDRRIYFNKTTELNGIFQN